MDIIVFLKSHRIDIDPDISNDVAGMETKEMPNEGDENLLKLRKMSPNEVDDEQQHTKIGM